jgi:hypothetical protein
MEMPSEFEPAFIALDDPWTNAVDKQSGRWVMSTYGMFESPGSDGEVWLRASNGNGGANCVEVAQMPGGTAIRDSKNPDGPRIILADDDWLDFKAAVASGDFDLQEERSQTLRDDKPSVSEVPSDTNWQRAANGIEVGMFDNGVALRDPGKPNVEPLAFSDTEWQLFVDGVRGHEFDVLPQGSFDAAPSLPLL